MGKKQKFKMIVYMVSGGSGNEMGNRGCRGWKFGSQSRETQKWKKILSPMYLFSINWPLRMVPGWMLGPQNINQSLPAYGGRVSGAPEFSEDAAPSCTISFTGWPSQSTAQNVPEFETTVTAACFKLQKDPQMSSLSYGWWEFTLFSQFFLPLELLGPLWQAKCLGYPIL